MSGPAFGDARCEACQAEFSVRDDIIDLVPDFVPRRTPGQAVMEWPPIVRIYESALWRRSIAASLMMGISFRREQAIVLDALAVDDSAIVLDLACGPGIYTREIARRIPGGQVVGLDISPPMLAYAAARASREGLRNVTWVHGDAMNLPFPDGSLDAASCCGALHLFPDPGRALSELHRVLKPGGRLVAAVGRRGKGLSADLLAAVAKRSGIASWTDADFRARLGDAGFVDPRCHYSQRIWTIWSARS
jgi:SAM-dependent methyltransferase